MVAQTAARSGTPERRPDTAALRDDAAAIHAADELLAIDRFGERDIGVRAAEQLLWEAGRAVDRAGEKPTAEASPAVDASKAFGGDVSLEATNEFFSLLEPLQADESANLHRRWRNAGIHTLRDPSRRNYDDVVSRILNLIRPPNHRLV